MHFVYCYVGFYLARDACHRGLHSFPTRRSSDLDGLMHPVGKRSQDKSTPGSGKSAYRMLVEGRAHAELVLPGEEEVAQFERELTAELVSTDASPAWRRTELRALQEIGRAHV